MIFIYRIALWLYIYNTQHIIKQFLMNGEGKNFLPYVYLYNWNQYNYLACANLTCNSGVDAKNIFFKLFSFFLTTLYKRLVFMFYILVWTKEEIHMLLSILCNIISSLVMDSSMHIHTTPFFFSNYLKTMVTLFSYYLFIPRFRTYRLLFTFYSKI